ncbi:hypothetical protein [Nocardioides sp.]|uniref:hypothetical protein n=1 Tax=Nocardioides sp. TaxID=35761 RepID=UPI002EDA6033
MPRRRPLVAAVLLLVGGLLAVAGPARAEAIVFWRFEQRPAGLPATAEPARTLTSADAQLVVGPDGSRLSARVELGGVPSAETGADLHLRLGTLVDGGCRTDWELVVPTLEPTGPATRDGTTIQVAVSTPQQDDIGQRCGSVALLGADGIVLDRLDDDQAGTAIADPGAQARIERVRDTRVRPWHWSTVWVRVGHHGADADGVRVSGAGRGLRVHPYVVHLDLHDGDAVWAPLEVRLRGARARELHITARPFGNLPFVFPGRREVVLRPTR